MIFTHAIQQCNISQINLNDPVMRKTVVSIGEKLKAEDHTALLSFTILRIMNKPSLCPSDLQHEEVLRHLQLLLHDSEEVIDVTNEDTDYVHMGELHSHAKLNVSADTDTEEERMIQNVKLIETLLSQPKYETEELAKHEEDLVLATLGHLLSEKAQLNPRIKKSINRMLSTEGFKAIICLKTADIYQDKMLKKYHTIIQTEERKKKADDILRSNNKTHILTPAFLQLVKPKFRPALHIILAALTNTQAEDTLYVDSLINTLSNAATHYEEYQTLELSSDQKIVIEIIASTYLMNCYSDHIPTKLSDLVFTFLKGTASKHTMEEAEYIWRGQGTSFFRYDQAEIFTTDELPAPGQKKRKCETPENKVDDQYEDGEISIIEPDTSSSTAASTGPRGISSTSAPSSAPPQIPSLLNIRTPSPAPQRNTQQKRKSHHHHSHQRTGHGHHGDDWYEPRGRRGRGRGRGYQQPHHRHGHRGQHRPQYYENFN